LRELILFAVWSAEWSYPIPPKERAEGPAGEETMEPGRPFFLSGQRRSARARLPAPGTGQICKSCTRSQKHRFCGTVRLRRPAPSRLL